MANFTRKIIYDDVEQFNHAKTLKLKAKNGLTKGKNPNELGVDNPSSQENFNDFYNIANTNNEIGLRSIGNDSSVNISEAIVYHSTSGNGIAKSANDNFMLYADFIYNADGNNITNILRKGILSTPTRNADYILNINASNDILFAMDRSLIGKG